MDRHTITADGLAATIAADGAELVSLRARGGGELIWQAGPEWPRHAPILFPIVGRLAGDALHHGGQTYRLSQHGFARDLRFAWLARDADACALALHDDEQTRALYPFAFRLELAYALAGGTLSVRATIHNPGTETLPASIGAHPAFAWPLTPGVAPEAHAITFARPEPAPIRRVSAGLLLPDPDSSPVQGDTLALRESLFARDALIFDQLASTSLRYTAPGAPVLTIAWNNMPQLGIWSKPAAFICIEPWHGFASPENFDGPFADKPGLLHIPPGQSTSAGFSIGVGSATRA